MKDKILYIVAGANGSGKTTFAKNLQSSLALDFINADEIARELDPSNTTGGELNAGKIFFQRVTEKLQAAHSFILESTLSGRYLLAIIKRAKKAGYLIEMIYLYLECTDLCIQRVRERVLKGGHHVPDQAVIRRYNRSINNFVHLYRPLLDKWLLILTPNSILMKSRSGWRTLQRKCWTLKNIKIS